MEALKLTIIGLTLVGLMTGSYLTGLTHGKMKVKEMLYLVERIEQLIGAIDVIEKGKTSGFTKAIINEE